MSQVTSIPARAVGLNYIDERRVASLEDATAIPKYRTVKRQIDMSLLSTEDIKQLDDLIKAFGAQCGYFLEQFERRDWRPYCEGSRYREKRDKLVAEHAAAVQKARDAGEAPAPAYPFGLQARHWKMALQMASDTVERYWRAIQRAAQLALWERKVWKKLTDAQRHYCNWILRAANRVFFDFLSGTNPKPDPAVIKEGPVSRHGNLCTLIRALVHEAAGSHPVHGESRSAWFDQSCWTLGPGRDGCQEISIMGLKRGRRIRIRVKGLGPVRGTLILTSSPAGLFIHVLVPIRPKRPVKHATAKEKRQNLPVLRCRAIDMGYTEVAVSDDGRRFGLRLRDYIMAFAQEVDDRLKKRNALLAQARNTDDPLKRRHILKFNLGEKDWAERRRAHRARIEACVNGAVNSLLKDGLTDVLVMENLSEAFRLDGISKKVRLGLSRWVRGLIDERLAFKAAVYGCRIAKVPAAYTSQCCPVCKHVDRKNRHGDRFHCMCCGYKADADVNAAGNILERAHNGLFTRYLGKDAVKKILKEEHEKWLQQWILLI